MTVFSIITVSYKNIAGLRTTQQSVKAQNFKDFEWIVIDGGSGDGTREFLQATDARWISEPDGGIYDAMNKGMTHAAGEYLIFLNAGDRLDGPQVLADLAGFIGAEGANFVYADSREETDGRLYDKAARPAGRMASGMITHHQAMVYRRSALSGLRYDTRYGIAADYDFTLRFLRQSGGAAVRYWPHSLCVFEGGGISQQRVRQGRVEQFHIRRRLGIVSAPVNTAIFAAQTVLWQLRRWVPGVYWAAKRRSVSRIMR